eukprot:scaffold299_cov343-Prasinococcus_capsulatus_cf.AAC.3
MTPLGRSAAAEPRPPRAARGANCSSGSLRCFSRRLRLHEGAALLLSAQPVVRARTGSTLVVEAADRTLAWRGRSIRRLCTRLSHSAAACDGLLGPSGHR